MEEKSADAIIKKIACSRFSGVVIEDELLMELMNIKPAYFWNLMIKEAENYNDEVKNNLNKVVDIYNLQLIYWALNNDEITEIKKREFFDSLTENEMVKKYENTVG